VNSPEKNQNFGMPSACATVSLFSEWRGKTVSIKHLLNNI